MPHPASSTAPPARLRPPQHGRCIARERLFACLDAAVQASGTWIWAPGGFGKSTLAASYATARGLRALWLQLDDDDGQAATLVHHLDQLARLALGRRWREPPPGPDDLRDPAALLAHRLLLLGRRLKAPTVLVLDNLHLADPAALEGLAAALPAWPPGVRLLLVGRDAPPPSLAPLAALRRLVLIDAAALRFDTDETGTLVGMHGRDWDARTLQALCDGWAAAMSLLLAGAGDAGRSGPTSSGTQATAVERLFAHFASDLLQRLTEAQLRTLIAVSHLPSASVGQAVAISGDPHAGALLADLAGRSLFTELRAGDPPRYTMHALLSAALQAHAREHVDPAQGRAWQHRAAALLAEDGQADAAIPRWLDLGAHDVAATALRMQAPAMLAQGRMASLRAWLQALPSSCLDTDPWLAYWLGLAESATQPSAALARLTHAHAALQARGDADGAFACAAAAADAIVFVGDRLAPLRQWLAPLEAGIDAFLAAPRDTGRDLRVLPGLLAAFVQLRPDDPRTPALADLAENLLEQPSAPQQRLLLGTLAFQRLWSGELARLDRILLKVDRLAADPGMATVSRLRWLGVLVLVQSLLGRADAAWRAAQQALAIAPPPMAARAHLMAVLAALAARQRRAARQHLDAAAQALDPGNAIDATTWAFQHGLLAMLEGDASAALRHMDDAVCSGADSGWPLREHIALIGRALALAEVGRFGDADAALQVARAHPFQRAGVWHPWIEALVEARLADLAGDDTRCLRALREALALARAHGYNFGPLPYSSPALMPRLMARALAHGIEPAMCQAIIRRHALEAPPEAGEHWPWTLRLRGFGRLRIERDERDGAPPPRKEGRKPLEMLKIVLALGGSAPVDRLTDALWPDADGDLARKSFDNALHRLRRRLGGDQHLLLRAGTLSLNAGSCWTDVGAAQALLSRAADAPADGTLQTLAARLSRLTLAPLLDGDDAPPALAAARAAASARLRDGMATLARRLAAAGDKEAARIVQCQLDMFASSAG